MLHTTRRFRPTLTTVFAILALAGAVIGVQATRHATAYAASCDKVNIVYCGLSGSDTASRVQSLRASYNNGADNGHTDLKAVYNWAGANPAMIAGMNTTNTKAGTLYHGGVVRVDGKAVAYGSWVTARFTEGSGYTRVSDGVWARRTTTSLAEDMAPVLVHYGSNGQVDFVVMVNCGNAVKATAYPVNRTQSVPQPKPVAPAPKPVAKPTLACTFVDVVPVEGTTRTYRFIAHAQAFNTTIQRYYFGFSDNTSRPILTTDSAAEVTHTFPANKTWYTVQAWVSSGDLKNMTSQRCSVMVQTAAVSHTY